MKASTITPVLEERVTKRRKLGGLPKNFDLYVLLLPGICFYLLFHYVPMFGLMIAFKDYNMFKGILGSDWVGLANFRDMTRLPEFYTIVRNTFTLSLLSLAVGFPAPVALALMLNEIRIKWFKNVSQSLLYLPHFMSWIILGGIVYSLLSPGTGIVNHVMQWMGLEPVYFMIDKFWWTIVYALSGAWASAGWGTIIYLAAMTTIDPSLYEAAAADGAGRWKQMIHITIPGILPAMIILFILKIGQLVSMGVEQPLALANAAVGDVSEVISTYMYASGIKQGNFSLTTAIGVLESLVNLLLIWGTNFIVKKLGHEGLW